MDGQNVVNEIAFSQPVINIGADSANDIVLRGNRIADFHVMLNCVSSNTWHLVPLDPSFSVLLNGRGIGPEGCTVPNGAVLSIGDYNLTISLNGINADILVARTVSASASAGGAAETADTGRNILLTLVESTSYEVQPGSSVEYSLTVTNAGPLVANMQIQLQGVPAAWVQIVPPVLNLNEGKKGSFQVRVSPPRDTTALAGEYRLHFVAISPNYPGETGTADTVLTVLPYSQFMVSGPNPRRLNLHRSHREDFSDIVILSQSNLETTYMVRSFDDGNDLTYAYKLSNNSIVQGQDTVSVRPGESVRVPVQVGARKAPLLGFGSKLHHYYTTVTPVENMDAAQSVVGEVQIRPQISGLWLILFLAVLLVLLGFILQPYIYSFSTESGKRTEVIVAGESITISWKVSPFASKVTLTDGTDTVTVDKTASRVLTPKSSTTYKLKAENFLTQLLPFTHEREFNLLLIPRRPSVDMFQTDKKQAYFNQEVDLRWTVSSNTQSAQWAANRQTTGLTPDKFSGSQKAGYESDVLFWIKAENESGFEMKSLFLNVLPDRINLKKFVAWVRPNGIAVPADNDVRRTTRWGSLTVVNDVSPTAAPLAIRPAAVNPQPAAQDNTLVIPDNFGASSYTGAVSPEQQLLSGSPAGISPAVGPDGSELLVAPATVSTPVPAATDVPQIQSPMRTPVAQATAPAASPERTNNREFSVKLVEVVEDTASENGYRVINYFDNYVLQKGEQVLIEWEVEGVPTVKIENLSAEPVNAKGSEFVYPEKNTNYTMEGEVGSLKQAYTLPLLVAGDADNGEGSGLNCELKANATSLTVPGTVMLTWKGGGNNRVQLLSSAKAEEDNAKAEKQKAAEAKEKGESYTPPKNPQLTGGIIGDWLQPAGFMRVNVDQQTSFVLNAFDGNGNIICTKSVDVQYKGGNDKLDIGFRISRIANSADKSTRTFNIGDTAQFTVTFSGYKEGKEPTGSVMVTDGDSTCSMTLPKTTCSMQLKHQGRRTITAVYSGDDTYNKKTDTDWVRVKHGLDLKLVSITDVNGSDKQPFTVGQTLIYTVRLSKYLNDLRPSGKVTVRVGKSSCTVNLPKDMPKKEWVGSCSMPAQEAGDNLKVTTSYGGDSNYSSKTAEGTVKVTKIPTKTQIKEAIKHLDGTADLNTILSWIGEDSGRTPTGTIKFTTRAGDTSDSSQPHDKDLVTGTCIFDIVSKTIDCEPGDGTVTPEADAKKLTIDILKMVLADKDADRIKAEYSGDDYFNPSESTIVKFKIEKKTPTTLSIMAADKSSDDKVSVLTKLSWPNDPETGLIDPTGTVTFKSGSATCILDLDTKALDGCTAGAGYPKVDVDLTNKTVSINIGDMVMNGTPGASISAQYSGDDVYDSSSASDFNFDKIDTVLELKNAYKPAGGLANVDALLSWVEDAGEKKPTGTVTFRIGNDNTCKMTLDQSGKVKDFSCEGESTTYDELSEAEKEAFDSFAGSSGSIGWKMRNILLSSNTADRIQAEYSGDDNFNPSTSIIVMFKTFDTILQLSKGTKSSNNKIGITVDLALPENMVDNEVPTGKITFTSGGATCVLNLGTNEFEKCSGSYLPKPAEVGSDHKVTITITNMDMDGTPGDSIYAKFDSDPLYNQSISPAYDFSKYDTKLMLNNAYLSAAGFVNVDALLGWEEEGLTDKPTGKVTFTIGSNATCELTLKSDGSVSSFSCEDTTTTHDALTEEEAQAFDGFDSLKDFIGWKMRNIMITTSEVPDRIKAEYSGDGTFNPSSSNLLMFKKVETELSLSKAWKNYRSNNGYANFSSLLTWDKDKAEGLTPTGTIKFISGSGTCELNITTNQLGCSSDTPISKADTDESIDRTIRNMLMPDKDADRIRAEYSGDSFFKPSSASDIQYQTIETSLNISDQSKSPSSEVNMNVSLIWTDTPPESNNPIGTIIFTSGSSSCTLDLASDPLKFMDCNGNVTFEGGKYKITNLDMPNAGEKIKGVYSGDGLFLSSESAEVSFVSVSTEISIESVTRPEDNAHANLVVLLSWDKEKAATRKPVGIINFTVGSGTCTLNLETNVSSCETASVSKNDEGGSYRINIEGMKLPDQNADGVKADFLGDAVFNPSNGMKVNFSTVDIIIEITKARKIDKTHANATAFLYWIESLAGSRKPSGTISFEFYAETVKKGSCELTIETGTVNCTSATVNISDDRKYYSGENMVMDDSTPDHVMAKYSGDGFFNPSDSEMYPFDDLETTVEISKAYRSLDGYVNMKSVLSWDEIKSEGRKPTGKITIKVGEISVVYNLTTKQLEGVSEGAVETDDELHEFVFTGLPFGSAAADEQEITIEYSGDFYFRNSTNKQNFKTIDTVSSISYGYHSYSSASGDVTSMHVLLDRLEVPPNNNKPTGSFDITVTFEGSAGTRSCSGVPIDGSKYCDNIKYEVLQDNELQGGDFAYKVYITDTNDNNKPLNGFVRYSGDGLYNGSTSQEYSFTIFSETVIIIQDALQIPHEGLKYLRFELKPKDSSDHNHPNGTVVISTSNGKSCRARLNGYTITDIDGSCQISEWNLSGDYHNVWTLYGMKFDMDEASTINVSYQGQTPYNGSFAQSGFTKYDTDAKVKTIFPNNDSTIDIHAALDFTKVFVGEDFANQRFYTYPTGKFVIKKDDMNICSFIMPEDNNGETYTYDLTDRCGGGSVTFSLAGDWGDNMNGYLIDILGLPVTDQVAGTYSFQYLGDWTHKSDIDSRNLENRVDSISEGNLTLSNTNNYILRLTVKSADSTQTAGPGGTANIVFQPSGITCTWKPSNTEFCSCSSPIWYQMEMTGTGGVRNLLLWIHPGTLTDESVNIMYDGDEHYNPSEGTVSLKPYNVTLTPETNNLYADGRLYFNIVQGVSQSYPFYPDMYHSLDPYSHCLDSSSTDCHILLYEFNLVVNISVDSPGIDLPSDAVINITTSTGEFSTTCTPQKISNGKYRCESGKVHFSSIGKKEVTASYNGSLLFENAEVNFPEMYAISIPPSPIESETVFIDIEDSLLSIDPGDTITVKAESYKKGDSSEKATGTYVFYAYNHASNKRLSSCIGTESCNLNIPEGTNYIVVEFLGNSTYAPSSASRSVIFGTVSNMSTSSLPVTLSLQLEP